MTEPTRNSFRRDYGQAVAQIPEPEPDRESLLARIRGTLSRAFAMSALRNKLRRAPKSVESILSPQESAPPAENNEAMTSSVSRNRFRRSQGNNRATQDSGQTQENTSRESNAPQKKNAATLSFFTEKLFRRSRDGDAAQESEAQKSAPRENASPQDNGAATSPFFGRNPFRRGQDTKAPQDSVQSENDDARQNGDAASSSSSTRNPFRRNQGSDASPLSAPNSLLRQLSRKLGSAFAFAGLLTLFVNLAMLFVPLYSMIVFDRVLQSKSYDTLTMLSIVCAVGMVLYGCLDFCRSLIFIVIADKLTRGLNISTLRASIARSLSGEPASAGQAVRDLDSLRMFASGGSPIATLDLLWTPIVLTVLYLLHPWYGHYALFCAGVLFVLSVANDLTTRESLIAANTAAANSLSDLSSSLRQRELIDGLGMLPEVARHWMRRQNKVLAQAAAVSRRATRFAVAAKTARLGMQAVGMAVGVILVIHNQASPGSLIGASILMGKLLLPFEQLITAWRQWIAALAAWRRMSDLLSTTPVRTGCLAPETVEGRLVLDKVGFAPATASAPIIEEISLTIEPGEVVAIVGPSGSGKSTLARLVMGILPPTSGQVTLDGIPTVEWDRTELARHVGYLAQSVGLLDGTILENIARMDVADSATAIDAAGRAGVHDLVGRLRDGYATQVGDSGQALSGGTRQRIALARALYGSPKLIVLDEPNANLDHDGEQALVRVIRQVRDAGTAVLLITHRPSILAAVDRVIGVERGRITRIETASGRPELAKPGRAVAQAAG